LLLTQCTHAVSNAMFRVIVRVSAWAAIPEGRGDTSPPPIIGVGDVNGIVPPKFVVFVSTLNSEEYNSTTT